MKKHKINPELGENRFQNLEQVPQYAAATIQKLMEKDYLVGMSAGLDLSQDMLRLLVINDRAGLYDRQEVKRYDN